MNPVPKAIFRGRAIPACRKPDMKEILIDLPGIEKCR